MARVGYLLEALRGAMRGSCAKGQPALFALAAATMSPLVCDSKALVHSCCCACLGRVRLVRGFSGFRVMVRVRGPGLRVYGFRFQQTGVIQLVCAPEQVRLQKAYSGQPAVTCQILKLAGDIVEAHISYLQVCRVPLCLLQAP